MFQNFDTRSVVFGALGFVCFGVACFAVGVDVGRSFPEFPSFGNFFFADNALVPESVEQARVDSDVVRSRVGLPIEVVEERKVQVLELVEVVEELNVRSRVERPIEVGLSVAAVVNDVPNVEVNGSVLLLRDDSEVASHNEIRVLQTVIASVPQVPEIVALADVLHQGILSV